MTVSVPIEAIEIIVDINFADYRRILDDRAKKTIKDNRLSLSFILISIVLTVLATAVTVGFADRTMQMVLLVMIAAFVFNLTFYGLFLWSLKAQAKNYANFEMPVRYHFRPEGIKSITKTTVTDSAWARFKRISETKSDILLHVSTDNFIAIPKRFILSDDRLARLRRLMKENANCELDLAQ